LKGAKVKSEEKPRRRLSIVILFIVVIIGLFLLLVNFITDWMWFAEMTYVSVFFKQLFTQLEIGIPVFIIIGLLMDAYLRRLRKGYFTHIASHEETDMKKLGRYTNIVAGVFALIIAFYASSKLWFKILEFANSTTFSKKDPLFGLDISFYIFKLDFLKQLNELLIAVILLFIIVTLLYYMILITMHSPDIMEEDETTADFTDDSERYTGSSNPFGDDTPFGKIFSGVTGGAKRQPKPRKHFDDNNFKQLLTIASGQLTLLGVVFFIMLGIDFFLKQFDLLHAHTGAVYGAGFTDVNITLWMYRVLVVLSLVGAITTVYHIRKKQLKKVFTVPVIMICVGIAGIGIALVVQNLVVSPDELDKESKYLSRNIEFTQSAYQLNNVSVKKFSATEDLTSTDISDNSQTISNIRINDYSPVKTFYNQTQSIRQYYTFNDVDVDRYTIDGKLTQTYLSTREIDESKISDTWLNRHIKYTHGYGITLSKVNTVTASGQPDVLIKNIPPESSIKEIQVTQPSIYFGELTNDYSLVNTSEDEFDYPDGSSNKYTKYSGTAGIKLNPFARIMFAIRENSLKLLVSTNISSKSKIIIYRNVEERVKKIMPYLSYEDDPYAVTVNGRIYWIVDAYTTSSYYPYSEPYSGTTGSTNYVRNSIKVVVDAYNGDVNYYIIDKNDPIAKTYQKIYPKLFKDFNEMPVALKSHIRYPNALFEIQANIYTRYHMSNVKVFYQNEDQWSIANEIYGTKEKQMTPNYYIIKLPGEKNAEFISSIPYTPKNKQNMTALMIARNDGANYGKIVLYQFPKSKTVYGPRQIESLIDQNTQISQDFSLWSSAGSDYSRGNLFVIPIKDSLLYVEPVYLEASGNQSIPEVKRVIVVYGDQIAYESTLGDALDSLFGSSGGADKASTAKKDGSSSGTSKSDYINMAQDAYNKAQSALKDGDWAAYGKYMDQLSEYLNKL
jgi:uncharacterized membrane protein (UPF0182 family)